jgi:outer membrane protein assembly factor BamB
LLRVDTASGAVVQTITLTAGVFGSANLGTLAGLQVLGAPMSLAGVTVAAGSLLVFNGTATNDRVVAIDPATGALIASLSLAVNADLTGGVFDPASGHLFVTSNSLTGGNHLVEFDASSGAQVAVIAAPFSVQTGAGLAISPLSGHLWLGSVGGGALLVEYAITGTGVLTELRRVNATTQSINQNEITGLAFAGDGALWVGSTQGELYRVVV